MAGSAVSFAQDSSPSHERASIELEPLVSRAIESIGEKTAALKAEIKGAEVPTQRDVWRHPSTHPLVLTLLLLEKYGQEYLEWHPDVLKLTMERDGIALSNRVWNKILASGVLLSTAGPWQQWEIFHWVCRALNGESPNFVYLDRPELGHLVVGVDIMHIIDPKKETAWDIDKFVAAVLRSEGLSYAPAPLAFAQRELEDPQIECTKCRALHRDDNDVRCVTCGGEKLTKVPYEFADLRDETKALFEARSGIPLADAVEGLPDSAAGNAVYRLLVDWDLLRSSKAQLVQQLHMIGGK